MVQAIKKSNGYKTYIGIFLYSLSGFIFGISTEFGPEYVDIIQNLGGFLQQVGILLGGTGIVHKITKAFPQAK